MFKTLLVPLDGSPFAEHALPVALAIARRGHAEIRLVSVVTPLAEAYVEGMYFSTADLEQQLATQQQTYLEAVRGRLRQRGEVAVKTQALHGDVAVTLNHLIDQGGIDLVVMATHGRGAFRRFWLGSVADEMIRHVTVPLLLVRPDEQPVALEREPELGKVVIALDGTPLAEQVIEPAVTLAGLMPSASVTLMRAIHPVVPIDTTPDVPETESEARHLVEQVQQMQAKLRSDAESYLEGVAGRLRGRGLAVQTEVVVEDQPAAAILHEAEKTRAGLIAVATHARRGLSRLMLGSVADKVVRGAHTPVLVYHPKQV
jgi:nucleotide-binding universal stress UspA family protein